MNIDEKIKQELEQEAKQLNATLVHDDSIFIYVKQAFTGSLGWLVTLISVIAFAVTLLLLWAGYQFFFVEHDSHTRLTWAMILGLSTLVQTALKMWTFMEMNRQSTIREIKRLELSVERLYNSLSKHQ
ncbi:hypothetical protein J7384_14970 [Endozoicomonas sp. G2_1]|uniref:DUF6768 family protein n=1 Tax=Endozoicomonas sp. G2_1 TaxID=2821091 RepID=UPI001ADC5EED|nr:DUF6768 family protein [Endozoicomonas sp. G2_1]MBO9491668.1 hypothetical protein [Endozoicomonas sp. G2_1]